MVMIAKVIMNEVMPDRRQVGLVHENYVSSIIWWVYLWESCTSKI